MAGPTRLLSCSPSLLEPPKLRFFPKRKNMNKQPSGAEVPLLFPALIRLDDKLLCTGSEITQYWKFRHHEQNTFSVSEPIRIKKAFLWMIDANGMYREFHEIGRYRKTPSFLKRIYNFTRIKYEITEPRTISAAEVRQILKGSRSHQKGFLQAISKLDDDAPLSPGVFLHDFLNEPRGVPITSFPIRRPKRQTR